MSDIKGRKEKRGVTWFLGVPRWVSLKQWEIDSNGGQTNTDTTILILLLVSNERRSLSKPFSLSPFNATLLPFSLRDCTQISTVSRATMDPAAMMNAAANTASYHLSEIWHFPPPNAPDALGLRRAHFAPGPTRHAVPGRDLASIAPKKRRQAEEEEVESTRGASTTNAVVPHSINK